jgi:hypothetical protein
MAMKHIELPTSRPNTLDQLDGIRIYPAGRRMANACLRESELLADVSMWLDTEPRRILAYAGRAFGAVARCSKVRAETLEPN